MSGASRDSCSQVQEPGGFVFTALKSSPTTSRKSSLIIEVTSTVFFSSVSLLISTDLYKKKNTNFFYQCLSVKHVKKKNAFAVLELIYHTNFCLHLNPPKDPNWSLSLTSPPCPTFSFLLPPFPVNTQAQTDWIIVLRAAASRLKKKKKKKLYFSRPRITFRSSAKVCSSSGSSVSWSCRVLRQSQSCCGLLQECFRGPASFPHLGFKCTFELLKAHRCV